MIDTETPVVLTAVTKKFGSTTAVRAVSWAPRRGRVTALVGLNGAGKSTLMRVMTGLVKPTEGSVSVVRGRRPLSAMIEAPALYKGLTVRRNLQIHRVLTGASRADAAEVTELTQIGDMLGRRVGALSQGYRQRLAIALALLGDPAVLLLDEPTNALDPEAIVHLRALIRGVAARNTAVVVSSHQLRELEGTADALTVLHDGQVLYDGPFTSFVGSPSLRVRALDPEGTRKLAELLPADGVRTDLRGEALHAVPDGQPVDDLARRVFAAAAEAGIDLVEVSHISPTLEEAFHTAISGARA
ncbi:ABC transporter ATP-binding protein [Amycolatopsis rhizosphaerae]|uniref:ABC transporter ATP-binding protein n=1 Tax=Amycolatopsis rhizosphaerae TaxID=2053003 RepID=A0A558DJF9_9PSEU|nr:ABC transporter ATP-binding protein [Amycolatopsis rhizosphaerae]TVT61146.1 ABC transporter ATP-binding protein [Amycolatopsis rhizosphaerae]